MIFLIDGSDFPAFVVFFKQVHSSIEQGMRGLGYYRDPKQDIGGVKGVWGLSEKRSVDIVYEQLHLFTMMKTRCGVKQGLWKCWFRLQNEIKTRWGDSKNEVGLKHIKTILKRGHS